jgi:hypothetical protein
MAIEDAQEARRLVTSYRQEGLDEILEQVEREAEKGECETRYSVDNLNNVEAVMAALCGKGFKVRRNDDYLTIYW